MGNGGLHGGRVLGPGARGARGAGLASSGCPSRLAARAPGPLRWPGRRRPASGSACWEARSPGVGRARSGGGTLLLPRGPPRWREAAGPGCEGGSALCWCPAGFPRLWKVGLAHGLDPLSPSAGAGGWAPGQRQSTCSRGFRLSLSLRVLKGTFLWLCPLPSIFRGRLQHTEASPGISALFTRGRTPSSATATAACTHWP